MLKLKKISRDHQVSVILRDKDFFFTRSFLLALALATIIHLTFLTLFHVSPFKIHLNQILFPATQLEVDFTPKDTTITAYLDKPAELKSGLPAVKPRLPILANTPNFLTAHPIEYVQEIKKIDRTFTRVEKEAHLPDFIPSAISAKQPPLSLIISGRLAALPVINKEKLLNSALPHSLKGQERSIFNVLVKGGSGRIFWIEPKQLTENFSLNKFAEKLLGELQFAADPSSFVIAGEIEFHFHD